MTVFVSMASRRTAILIVLCAYRCQCSIHSSSLGQILDRRSLQDAAAEEERRAETIDCVLSALSGSFSGRSSTEEEEEVIWPYVTNSDFDTLATLVQEVAPAVKHVSFCPIVAQADRANWEAFSQSNADWVTTQFPEETVSSRIYRLDQGSGNVPESRQTGAMCPIWQHAPLSPRIVNLNLRSLSSLDNGLQSTVENKVLPATDNDLAFINNVLPNSQEQVSSFSFSWHVHPILSNGQVVGQIVALVDRTIIDMGDDGMDPWLHALADTYESQTWPYVHNPLFDSLAEKALECTGQDQDSSIFQCPFVRSDQMATWESYVRANSGHNNGLEATPTADLYCPLWQSYPYQPDLINWNLLFNDDDWTRAQLVPVCFNETNGCWKLQPIFDNDKELTVGLLWHQTPITTTLESNNGTGIDAGPSENEDMGNTSDASADNGDLNGDNDEDEGSVDNDSGRGIGEDGNDDPTPWGVIAMLVAGCLLILAMGVLSIRERRSARETSFLGRVS